MLARSKLNSIENKLSEVLINNQISHKDFMTIINKVRNYRELKENIRMMKGEEVKKIDNGKTMILSKCAICGSKKSKFIKNQEASGILSSLGISFKSYKRWNNNIIKMCCMW